MLNCLHRVCSIGLGLEFVRQLLQRPGAVVATARNPEAAIGLQELQQEVGNRLQILQLDTTSEESIQNAYKIVEREHGRVDRLLNVSGLLHDKSTGMMPETSYSKISKESLMRTFETNACGHMLVCKEFLPLMIRTGKLRESSSPCVIANLSARVGSISDNELGGWYSYRASKTALNQLNKCLSIELRRKKANVATILLHPGTCDTDLSKPFQRNVPQGKLFTRERGVEQLLRIVENVTIDNNGDFIAWDGTSIAW